MEFKVFEEHWFSTPIWECQVTGIDNSQIREYCYEVRRQKPGVNISNRGGWHSAELLYPIPGNLEKLFKDLEVFVNDVCEKQIGINNLRVGNFWININGHHDYNMPHDHQNSVLSGVYYVYVPSDNMGNLVLHRGDTAEFFLTSKVKRTNTFCNSLQATKQAKESSLYIFPSWVKHHVERNESNQERISIAFNFVPEHLL